MSDAPRSVQSWVSTIQTVVLTADVFQLVIKTVSIACEPQERIGTFLAKRWTFSDDSSAIVPAGLDGTGPGRVPWTCGRWTLQRSPIMWWSRACFFFPHDLFRYYILSIPIYLRTRTSYCVYVYPVIYTQDSVSFLTSTTLDFCRLPAADARTYIRTRYQYHSSTFSSMYQYVMCGMYIVQQYNTAFKKKLAVRVIRVQHR